MAVTWCKRFRMEYDLGKSLPERPVLDGDYPLLPWKPGLFKAHAAVKYYSFRNEIDACVFPSLSTLAGCENLMKEIAGRDSFLPEATWLAAMTHRDNGRTEFCGTIQALQTGPDEASIQNVGVVPGHRNKGIARNLLNASLHGLAEAGLARVSLEVTAINRDAVRLYLQSGFQLLRPVYKAIEYFPA
jgi:GNAT superfamily N-acetyltransferase